ncbi:2-amino-4-hydroxy-6-hydroxymethyldihydropteridine diphosphokinase [Aquimarina sp. ERC-38]|uniref:2-amino-4-hydroxy-6- hydroxymethyldihydropteridine diphosphokinase n=1 Tax=Aquimarina sp. ERC-38 TaxID=2949996 RepID=UPI002246DE46|nr:2-amino-4-hydroxy-6-hydroxymethyldihydropteridine diphosphokinase [Aquimarina sp. ERC-38]UZO81160.1 2-amino-4-hydroxy-6-hydroxymethyldihydropteridine diphosphokinase [Aquimarina sp. ERC-38]
MNTNHFVYIGLGSNQGDRLATLQKGINAIFEEIGAIEATSSVYQTPAWGFKGDDFYNACIKVKTLYAPDQVLSLLLTIENRLGRKRKDGVGYTSRTIDLDILYYDLRIIKEQNLTIPHPLLHQRAFVLKPLSEIAPELVHPVFKKTNLILSKELDEDDQVMLSTDSLKDPASYFFKDMVKYIAVEGVIGAGKTTLARMIAEEFNGLPLYENFKENDFLPKFYRDMDRYAFPLEMSFLAERYHQLLEVLDQYNLFHDFIVSDYEISKSLIFSKVTLAEEEFKLYRQIFEIMYSKIKKPDVYVYLYQNVERLLIHIKKRGRAYEQQIQPDYLVKLQKGYLAYLKSQLDLNYIIIDVTEKDFTANRKDFTDMLTRIKNNF